MARKIAVTLRKGGSGKTTTAINLAAALHLLGKRVLLIDLDSQANATLAVGIDPTNLPKHINHLFTDYEVKPTDTLYQTRFGMHVLPSHPDLAQTEAGMVATQIGVLKSILEPLDPLYDYIIIDTPPSEGFLTVNALAASDEVIVVVQAHFLAMQGLAQALTQVHQVKNGLNPKLKVAGILPTMVNQRTNISKTVLDQVKSKYPDLVYPIEIDYSVRHPEATLAGLPIVLFEPEHSGSIAYKKLADIIVGGKNE
jgi:chromosome partitioning protein